MLLTLKTEENNANIEEQQQREDKHVYECLKMKDYSSLTPIHWAATQESVSKRQKMFAYLDKRMPGVLDSRYNQHWFHSWVKTHPWVIEDKSTRNSSVIPLVKLTHPDQTYQSDITSLDVTPKTSNNDYERTPRPPLATTTNQRVQVEPPLPSTPMTSCKVTVTSIYHIPKRESSEQFTYRAHRVHIGPTIDFPPPPPTSDLDDQTINQHDYEDMNSPLSSKRPSHNLLSNIVPSIPTPSSDQSSQQSSKPIASSFGFDTPIETRRINDSTLYSNPDTYEQHDEVESISSNDCESTQFDYICQSTSTLGINSPGTQTFYT
jgi:hypothetical protein